MKDALSSTFCACHHGLMRILDVAVEVTVEVTVEVEVEVTQSGEISTGRVELQFH